MKRALAVVTASGYAILAWHLAWGDGGPFYLWLAVASLAIQALLDAVEAATGWSTR